MVYKFFKLILNITKLSASVNFRKTIKFTPFTYCLICKCPLKPIQSSRVCQYCTENLQYPHHFCKQCANPLEFNLDCELCLTNRFCFDETISAFLYKDLGKNLTLEIKKNFDLALIDHSCNILLEKIKKRGISFNDIVYIPSSLKRNREQGNNCAHLIAKNLYKKLKIPIINNAITFKKNGKEQKKLNAKERIQNTHGRFQSKIDFNKKDIAIIDDIVTSGATANSFAKVLLSNNANKVFVISIAKTPLGLI